MRYIIVIHPVAEEDGGGYVGVVPDLPGCMSDGETPEIAALNTQQAIGELLELNQRLGREIPKPRAAFHSGEDASGVAHSLAS